MDDVYKPLFSRRYLKALLWVLPVVILLLASTDPGRPAVPAIRQQDGRNLYWLEQPDSPVSELRLLYATGAAIGREQWLAQRGLAQLLQARLQALSPAASVDALPDRLQLRLRWPADAAPPDFGQLASALAAPFEPETVATTLERLRAHDYLDARAPDQRLLNGLRDVLRPEPEPPASAERLQRQWQRLLQRAPLVLVGGPDATDTADLAARALPPGTADTPEAKLATIPVQRQLRDDRVPAMRLSGGPAPGRDARDYAAERLAFTALQLLLDAQPGLQYRLLWLPLRSSGYRALILPATVRDPAALLQVAEIPGLAERALDRLQRQYRERLDTPDGQLDMLTDIAFYDLPERRLDALTEALAAVPKGDIAPRMAQYLAPDSQIRIELNGVQEGGER